MRYIVGIDQGASKTLAAVADEYGNILGVGQGGGAYHALTGIEHAMDQILAAVRMAEKAANITLGCPIALGAGMTGADFDYEYIILQDALGKVFSSERTTVVNDCMIALRAGTRSRNAAVICAGTGLNCGVRAGDGREFVFGYAIDDYWQGGAAIGKRALMSVFEADSGMLPETKLTPAILDYFQINNVEMLMQAMANHRLPNDQIKHLALLVDRLAGENDDVSMQILKDFGEACARYAVGGLNRLAMLQDTVDVVLSGSIFKSSTSILRETISTAIHLHCVGAEIVDGKYEPVVGGVVLALEQLYGTIGKPVVEAVEHTAQEAGLVRLNHLIQEESV